MTKKQEVQESEYAFPYHYISAMPAVGFRQHVADTWGINYVSTICFLLDHMENLSPNGVLDIGCGDGRLTREIRLRFKKIAYVAGVDYSERAVALARALNGDVSDLSFFSENIVQTPVVRRFDVVTLMEVLEHIPLEDIEGFVQAVADRVESGGHLLLTVPHANKPVEYKHVQHFTEASLLRWLNPHFVIEKVLPFEKIAWQRSLINRVLCNRLFVLNSRRLLAWVYNYYERHLFECSSEDNCQRLFVHARVVRR